MKKFPINKTNFIVVVLAVIFSITTYAGFRLNSVLSSVQQGRRPYRYTEEKNAELFPFDAEEAAAIDNSAPSAEGETWAIYMYFNASNLELDGHSQLSSFIEFAISETVQERQATESAASKERIKNFIQTEEEAGVPMPLVFYEPDYDKGHTSAIPEEEHSVREYTWGTDMLNAFRDAEFPENYTFVIQPGGATAWKDPQMNVNRTRRYVKQGNELVEVYDAPLTNMGESETLADFLRFCQDNYPADHVMVILSDHGGAMTGFGWDNIYGDDNLTLQELREAFDAVYDLNEEDPPINLLYFNACLMSNSDVIYNMRGIAEYMVAGEEVGLSLTEYYTMFSKALQDMPNANAMQLGKALIDQYTIDLSKKGTLLGEPQTSGLCLLDMRKAPKVHEAYMDFAGTVLADTAENPQILAALSRAVSASISFAVNHYKSYNLTDLGLWMAQLEEVYPQEAAQIIALIDDAVIYKRADSYLKDAHGISVYFPNYVETTASLSVALKYIDQISCSEDISALYYYKLAGCLNDRYQAYCTQKGIDLPNTINYAAFEQLRNFKLDSIDEQGNVAGTFDTDLFPVLMDARYELCKVDELSSSVTYYGEDRFVVSDGGYGFRTEFEGKWVAIGSVPFAVNVLNVTNGIITYESPIKYQGYDYKLIILCQPGEDGEDVFTIQGLRVSSDEAATIDRNVVALKPGSYITPVYHQSDIKGGELQEVTGESVLYSVHTRIQDERLSKGLYRVRIVFEDMRGDDVYSAPVFFTIA